MTLRRRLYLILEPNEKGGTLERVFEFFLIGLILLNIVAIIVASVKNMQNEYTVWFGSLEVISIIFFTLEYAARIYSIVEKHPHGNAAVVRVKFIRSPLGIIDLFAFLPFYLVFLPLDLRFLRIFRLMALFRVFKIARYLHALDAFGKVIKDRKEQLVLSLLFILFVLVFISFVMFYAENEAQPEKFSSIPATMWWGVETLTTVGYGDMIPITVVGKILGGIFAIAGVGLLALPVGILSAGFFEILHKKNKGKEKCPHCGGNLHE